MILVPSAATGNSGRGTGSVRALDPLCQPREAPVGATDDPRTIVLWFQASVGVVAGTLLVLQPGPVLVPSMTQLALASGVGLLSMAGQLTMTHAYRLDRAPRVAAAAYSGPIFGFALDAIVFGTGASWTDAAGAVVRGWPRAHCSRPPASYSTAKPIENPSEGRSNGIDPVSWSSKSLMSMLP